MDSPSRRSDPSRRRAFFRGLVRRRRTVVACAVVGLAAAAAGAARLTVDYSVEQFFPDGGPERRAYDRFRGSFPREDAQVVFLFEAPPEEAGHRGAIVDGVVDAFRLAGLEDVQAVVPDPGIPALDGILWSRDGYVRSIVGFVPATDNDDAGRARIEERLTERLDALDLAEGSWVLTGTPVIRARVATLFARDQAILLGGGIAVFFVVLWLALGGAAPAIAALATVVPAYFATLGVMGAVGQPVTLLTGFTAVVVLVVGLCDVVHVLEAARRSRARFDDHREAVVDAFADLVGPCFYTSLTTAVGFAALAMTGVGIVVDFGLFTALAVMSTWVFAMTLLPALLSLGPVLLPASGGASEGVMHALVGRARTMAAGRRTWRVGAAFTVVAALAATGAGHLEVDTRLVDDLRPGSPVLRDLRWAEDRGFGVFQLNVFVEGVGARALEDPTMARWLAGTEGWLADQSPVLATLGPATAARTGAGLAGAVIDPEASSVQILVTVPDVGSARLLPVMERIEARLASDPPPVGRATLTGTVAMAQTFSARLLGSFGSSLALAVALIAAVMAWMFRSVPLGLLALVPNLFPLVVLGGCLALVGVDLKPSTILVFSIAFGIAVDDSVHLLARYTAARGRGEAVRDAVDAALEEAGPAILLTTGMVTVGFSLLLLSSFQVLALIGGMSIVTAVAAVAADLVLFPSLLTGRDGPGRPGAPAGAWIGRRATPREGLRGGVAIPVGRRLQVRVFFRPGGRLPDEALARLAEDLRAVAATCLGGRELRYGPLSGERRALTRAVVVLLRDRRNGRPLGFTAATLLPVAVEGRARTVLHMGLSMVVPGLQGRGVARMLVSLPPALVVLRSFLRPVWVTNVSQVPAAVGMFGEAVRDLHPDPGGRAEPPGPHRAIAEELMRRHRDVFGVGEDAWFDADDFVIRNAYTGGSDDLKKDWAHAQPHRDDRWNRLCRARLDYVRGDDVLQVGRMTVGHTVRALGRSLLRSVRRRRPGRARRRSGAVRPGAVEVAT